MGRKLAREATMKLLFQMEITNDYSEEAKKIFIQNNEFTNHEKEYIEHAITNIIKNLNVIDENIQCYIKGWKINRLAKVDLSVLRIAFYELMFRNDIPVEVCINEAIEICKKYSIDESSKFINGVLGNFVKARNDNGD